MPCANLRLFPESPPLLPDLDFKFGDRGAHTSRTMMLAELSAVLSSVPMAGDRDAYTEAVVIENCTGKTTSATRRSTLKRLVELYALDPRVPVFRSLRRLWDADREGRSLMALTCALARDPRLRLTAPFVVGLPPGADLQREVLKDAVRSAGSVRLNEATLDKVVRNAASTWVQSGHLEGRTFKRRRKVTATPSATVYAAYLAYRAGFRGGEMFVAGWFRILDLAPERIPELLLDARRQGLVDIRIAGDVVSISFDYLEADLRGA